jgi:2-polyprenyl-6-methoxyphenol hydroxylase-like FAD-dependent oxidoreductase
MEGPLFDGEGIASTFDRDRSGFDVDVCVAGGGPGGLACAIAAAMKGLSVLVVDGMKPPIDKACGEGLMPDSMAALVKLGVDWNDRGENTPPGYPLRGIRFVQGTSATEAVFPSGEGRGIRRVLLHNRLLARTEELGVKFGWQTVVREVVQTCAQEPEGQSGAILRTNRGSVRAKFVVGADGLQSRVRSSVGLDRGTTNARRVGLRMHFAIAPWTDFVEVYWSDHGQAYVTPISDEEVCVIFVARKRFLSVAAALEHFPGLQARLGSASSNELPRSSITLNRKLRRVTRGSVALLGDASGSVDAVTGEGLSLCFRQALALADAMAARNLGSYQQAHTTMIRLPYFMARTLLLLDRSPRFRAWTINTFERYPNLFAQLLGVHLGHPSFRFFGPSTLLAAGGRFRSL